LSSLEISALFGIEPLMYFGVGFFTATLMAIAIVPFALNRAVRLTTRRVMSTIPHSLSEARAEQDSARAMFAVAIRKLETKTEQLITRVTALSAQLGQHINKNARLKEALDEKSKLVTALETREGAQISRENSLIQELLALRDENRKHRDFLLHMRLPTAPSPWK
jgi:predicted  nucleic acid-binding Zn-ribbon protein